MVKRLAILLMAMGLMLSLTGCCCLSLPQKAGNQATANGTEDKENTVENEVEVVVPNFVGMHIDEISNNAEYMENFIFDTANQKELYSEQPVGTVLEQSLEPGLRVKKGVKTITLTVSKGPRMVPVANVVGMEYTQAKALLQNQGFSVYETFESNEEVAADRVIAVRPAEYPTELMYGAEVTLVVSTGAAPVEPVEVPSVVGLPKGQAITLLQQYGLAASYADITYVNNAYMPADTVISQSVTGTVAPGTIVRLTVSTGYADVKLQIPLPDSPIAVDVYIYVEGQLDETVKSVLPNQVRAITRTYCRQKSQYSVMIGLAKAGANAEDALAYMEYLIDSRTGTAEEVYLDEDVLKQYEAEIL